MADEKRNDGQHSIEHLANEFAGNPAVSDAGRENVPSDWEEETIRLNENVSEEHPKEAEHQTEQENLSQSELSEPPKAEGTEKQEAVQSGETEDPIFIPPEPIEPERELSMEKDTPKKSPKWKHPKWSANIAESVIYVGGVLLISFIIATVGWRWANDMLALDKSSKQTSVMVSEGENIDAIADELKEKGLIQYKYLFKIYAGFTGKVEKITAGSYKLNTEMDYSALLNNIGSSSAYRETVTVTIPEGYTVKEVFKLMDEKDVCDYDSLMKSAKSDQFKYDFLDDVKAKDGERLEGYLFPDTYEFYKKTAAKTVISKMLYNFSTRFDEKMDAEMKELGYSKNEIIILASIIEKETDGSDQKNIASVLNNRLKNTWASPRGYLQVDSTIQYLLETRKKTLTQADLKIDSPYNTYKYPGLPTGAICNPGLTAIKAALEPNHTNYYYFMLGKDGITHFFENQTAFLAYKAEQKENDDTNQTTDND